VNQATDTFDDGTLTLLTLNLVSWMTDTVTIRRPTVTDDGLGGVDQSYADIATVRGFFYKDRLQKEALQAGELKGSVMWTCSVPKGTDVQRSDQLVQNEGQDGESVFEVIATNLPATHALTLDIACVQLL
jgi:hypothetical protein